MPVVRPVIAVVSDPSYLSLALVATASILLASPVDAAELRGHGGGVRGVRLGELLLVEDELAVAVGLDPDVGERACRHRG